VVEVVEGVGPRTLRLGAIVGYEENDCRCVLLNWILPETF
jgi:hypothetical protein